MEATKSIFSASLLAVCATSCPIISEAQSADTGSELEEIVVTAQKRSESINTVPQSINVATGDLLLSAGIKDTGDLARLVPSFSTVTSFYGTPVYYLRGVGYYDTSTSARPAVTIYADEAPIPYSVMALGTTLDLERVEVLKGPQGTLFGSNSTGGAINFIAAKPTSDFHAGGDLTYGRFDNAVVSAFVSGPITDTFLVRVAASHETSGDWQKSYIDGQELGKKDITSGRATLQFSPDGAFKAVLTLSGTHDGSEPQVGQLVAKNALITGATPAFNAFPLAPNNARATAFGRIYPGGAKLEKDNNERQGVLRLDYETAGGTELTSLTSYARFDQLYGQNAAGTSLEVNALTISGDIDSFAQELRAAGEFADSKVKWIVGGNYERDKTSENTRFDIVDQSTGNVFGFLGLPPIDDVPTKLDTEYDSYAAFASFDYDFADTFTAHAGARYTNTEISYEGCTENAGNLTYGNGIGIIFNATGSSIRPLVAGDCVNFTAAPGGGFQLTRIRGVVEEDGVSWRVGLDWKPADGKMIYGNVSRGYKAAGISNIAAVFDTQYVPVPQEELTAYEIGAKLDLGRRVHLNAAAFYYDYVDKQLQGTLVVPIFGPLQALVSIPKSSITGAELDLTARPIDGLTLQLQGSYVDSEVKSNYLGTTVMGPTANFEGAAFPNTPKWQGAATIDYAWAVTGNLEAFVGSRVSYRGHTSGDFIRDPLVDIPSYTLLDANVGVRSSTDSWSVQLWGRNLTDKYYWPSQVVTQESIVRYAGMPRTYGITASYRY